MHRGGMPIAIDNIAAGHFAINVASRHKAEMLEICGMARNMLSVEGR